MPTSVKVIADSISPNGIRITTLQLQYQRFIHSELLTHRVFSRNASSSRAIPIQKMIDQVLQNPAMPVWWGRNQSGMQAREELDQEMKQKAILEWQLARHSAIAHAQKMVSYGVHKQIVNRLLEPWQEMQTIVTSTEWNNFYKLRCHPDAQPEIKALAETMRDAMVASEPKQLEYGQWHLPYVSSYTNLDEAKKWSTARCARVSFLTHNNQNPDSNKDEELHDRLLESGHFSPFEHQATPKAEGRFYANFFSWQSYRNQLGF